MRHGDETHSSRRKPTLSKRPDDPRPQQTDQICRLRAASAGHDPDWQSGQNGRDLSAGRMPGGLIALRIGLRALPGG
jgi:hypothetical protein